MSRFRRRIAFTTAVREHRRRARPVRRASAAPAAGGTWILARLIMAGRDSAAASSFVAASRTLDMGQPAAKSLRGCFQLLGCFRPCQELEDFSTLLIRRMNSKVAHEPQRVIPVADHTSVGGTQFRTEEKVQHHLRENRRRMRGFRIRVRNEVAVHRGHEAHRRARSPSRARPLRGALHLAFDGGSVRPPVDEISRAAAPDAACTDQRLADPTHSAGLRVGTAHRSRS